ncbi:MAG: hypothetical protein L3J43_08985 [Sulfurovum sp.]|nr:hypothetical protein [Sulfurovum sp.]
MHILLINKNPVVSRLFSLVTRNESIILEEVKKIEALKRDTYDIVFVDESVYEGKVKKLQDYINVDKKILFTHSNLVTDAFDITIKKPFLPSQILEVLEVKSNIKNDLEADAMSTQVLDSHEVEKIKELLDMNNGEHEAGAEDLSDEEYEARKVKAIKEQLIAEGLEIVEEEELLVDFDEGSTSGALSEDKIFIDKVIRKKMNNKSRKKKLAAKQDDLVVQAVEMAIRTLKKKQRKQLLKGKKVEITIQLEGKH